MSKMIALRDAYGEALAELGKANDKVVALEADVGGSSKSIIFGKEYPERYFNVGIAEGNMCAMAAGFASSGLIPYVNTFAAFMTTRAADPVNCLICYSNYNVKLAGTYAGLSDSYDGASHHAISDIAFVRSIPNMNVVCVADAVETKAATKSIANIDGPVYLRLSRAPVPVIFGSDYKFEFGKGVVVKEGSALTIVATGYMVYKALKAAEQLHEMGIDARVVNIHTIKPIDKELLVKCAEETDFILTVEEHNIFGGLGSAVSEALAGETSVPVKIMGINDCYAESGDYEELLEKYGLGISSIVKTVIKFIDNK